MRPSRAFVIAAILVLGLGLGVNVTLFNTACALLWRPLDFPNSNRLVTLSGRSQADEADPVPVQRGLRQCQIERDETVSEEKTLSAIGFQLQGTAPSRSRLRTGFRRALDQSSSRTPTE